jgi:hypothetical protein
MCLSLALALTLAACRPSRGPTPPPSTTTNYCAEPSVIVLDKGWRFRTDRENVGIAQEWHTSSWDDSEWRPLAPGKAWEHSGLEYDGVAWYRSTFTMPDWATVYLGFGVVDDVATLWLNGERQMRWEATDSHSKAQALNITGFVHPGEQITLALRIEDHGGYGGIKGPITLSDEPRGVMGETEYLRWLFDTHNDWPMPEWLRGGPVAWTMVGRPRSGVEALVRSDGAVAPWANGPTAEVWLYDPATGELATGTEKQTTFSLYGNHLPMPTWQWEALGADVTSTLYSDTGEQAVRWEVSVRSATQIRRDLVVLLVVRPLAIDRSLAPICSVGLEGDLRLWMDGSGYLIAGTPPEAAGVGSLDDVMTAALRGMAPDSSHTFGDEAGLAAAALVYPLSVDEGEFKTLSFAFPNARLSQGEQGAFPKVCNRLEETAAFWEDATSRTVIDVPDELVDGGLRASTAYLLLALDASGPHPGPLTHDAMWVRDAAYIGLALLQTGHADAVRSYVPHILASQEADGRIPPIQGDDIPWDDEEWDAQGQTIFLATRYYRFTGDLKTLRAWYPSLRAAARFIVDLRESEAESDGPAAGLLPPSKSAEDLGPEDRHYYWDNFWSVVGLEEGAYAARVLGKPEDAAWMEAEADRLREAILRSVERVMGSEPAYIPGAVEDLESSAMARGTVPALWPVRVLSPDSVLVQRSFDAYHKLWIDPDSGGFRHRHGQFWPYGGLELAHAYLRLGDVEILHEILGWTLEHQTLPGTYAWAEQVDPETGGISGGDMPHAWAAASYATLVREMIVSERDGYLELFIGVPDWWFEDDQTISVTDAPTYFGVLDLHTQGTLQNTNGRWDGVLRLTLSGAKPPEGYRWKVPSEVTRVDGPPGVTMQNGWLTVPAPGGTVRLTFSPQD